MDIVENLKKNEIKEKTQKNRRKRNKKLGSRNWSNADGALKM